MEVQELVEAARTRLMEQLIYIVMAASGITLNLKIVDCMMTTILCQMKFVVHVEVFSQSQGSDFIESFHNRSKLVN